MEKIIETRLGPQKVSNDKLVIFPRGIIGFEHEREFALLQMRGDLPFLMLQSTTTPSVGLLVTDPYTFYPEYQIEVGDPEQKILKVQKREQLSVLVTVYIPPNQPEKTSMNLSGPILINHELKIGLQVPQVDGKLPAQMLIKS